MVKRKSQGDINRKGGRDEYKMIAAINENTGSTALILRGANLSSSHLSTGCNAPLPPRFPLKHAHCPEGQLVFTFMNMKGRGLDPPTPGALGEEGSLVRGRMVPLLPLLS